MKDKIDLGAVIAQRELTDLTTGNTVLVSVGTPKYLGDSLDWACPYAITGLVEPIYGHAQGIDALQSLQLVSVAIRRELEKTDCPLTFLGNANWQSNFPDFVRDFGEPDLRVRIENLIVNEQANWLEEHGVPASRLPEQTKNENTEQEDV